MPIIKGPAGMDPILGKMRTKDVSGGTASGDYTFNTAEFTVGQAGLVSLNQVPASKLDTVLDIMNVTGASVTLQPNTAYKIYATSQAITLNANPPAAGKWAYEGHIELFVAGTGYVVTGTNVVLANALEPDSVNNCTVRFHDGIAIISVEDHLAGYIVVNGSTAGDGSLAYGIATSTNEYIAFDASLNGTVIPLAGAVAEGEKHIVGNGYNETTLTGAVDCSTAKVTVANLSLSDVGITGGTMTLGDAFIPSGSTVAVSGGGLAVEKVTGAGSDSVIDLGKTHVIISSGATASASGCSFVGTTTSDGGAFYFTPQYSPGSKGYASLVLSGVTLTGLKGYTGGAINCIGGHTVYLYDSIVSGNNGSSAKDIAATFCAINVFGGTVGDILLTSGAKVNINNNCSIDRIYTYTTGTVTISSGAVLDLTGNTNTTPIAPGGGIVFEAGGATILYGDSSGTPTSSAVISGGTIGGLGNDGTILPASGSYIHGGSYTGIITSSIIYGFNTSAAFTDCSFNQAYWIGNAGGFERNGTVTLGGTTKLVGSGFILGARNLGTAIITSDAIIDASGYTWATYDPFSAIGTLVIESGAKWTSDGTTMIDLSSGTYISGGITKNGTVYGTPQE